MSDLIERAGVAQLKTCNVCKLQFPPTTEFFYAEKERRDGLRSSCKTCQTARSRKYRKTAKARATKAKYRESHRDQTSATQRAYIAKNPGVRTINSAKWRGKYPHKNKAQKAIWTAIRNGSIVPLPCFVCGDKGEAHHPDYDAPLDVVWLCRKHHAEAHVAMKEPGNG